MAFIGFLEVVEDPRGPTLQNVRICKLDGCNAPVHVAPDGKQSEFCTRRHGVQAVKNDQAEGCMSCKALPKESVNGKLSDFCSKQCGLDMFALAPVIELVPSNHAAWTQVATQFRSQWLHDNRTAPSIQLIWKIYGTKLVTDRFLMYKATVAARTRLEGGNSRRRWHGTRRECSLGDWPSVTTFCSSPTCSLCSIIRTSFDLSRAQSNIQWGRFGGGIYTSATSSKANAYSMQGGALSPFKAMILSDVVMGRPALLTEDYPGLRQPPPGFDSVVGEPGVTLNYDESVVYRNDAIRPLFLIIYDNSASTNVGLPIVST